MSKNDEALADRIATLCFDKYATLSKNGKPIRDKEWTLLAGFAVEEEEKEGSHFYLVSLATGTKCIGRSFMMADGTVLNDSHAEVLARRCLLRYFYHQLQKIRNGQSSKLFRQHSTEKDKFECCNFKLHMFTSHVPCGDASILLKEEPEEASSKFKDRISDDVSDNKSEIHGREVQKECFNYVSFPGLHNRIEMSKDDEQHIKQNLTNSVSVSSVNISKLDDYEEVLVRNCNGDTPREIKCNVNRCLDISSSSSTNVEENNSLTDYLHDVSIKKRKIENNYCDTFIEDSWNISSETSRASDGYNLCNTAEIFKNTQVDPTHYNHNLKGCLKNSSIINNTESVDTDESSKIVEFQKQSPVSRSASTSIENKASVGDASQTCFGKIGFCKDGDHVGNIVVRDLHRTGAKCLPDGDLQDARDPGIGYHVVGVVRTKPGRGDPTLSVSCSDKIARWIDVGVQGALLSTILDKPIHISSITVGGGGPYSTGSMLRALVLRSSTRQSPVLLRSKLVFESSRYVSKAACKPCASSIMWTDVPERSCEVSAKGYRLGATKSAGALEKATAVCRRSLFKEIIRVTGERYLKSTYAEAKKSSCDYLAVCSKFKTQMGSWTEKDPKLADFTIDTKEMYC